jgi:uncharacterized protein with GYD domain
MASYIGLTSWTEQGIKSYRDSIDRAEAVGQLAAKVGVTIKQIYWTLGAYDLVSILEAADDESVTAFMLALSAQGNVRTTTMRAFDAAEMREIVAKAAG